VSDDSGVWYVSEKTYDWLWEQINNPLEPSESCKQACKRVWESDKDHDDRIIRSFELLEPPAC